MTGKPARILIIAGSDSSGGAGIQADIKTATALGAYAMTAVTAVTVQDTTGVKSIHPIPASVVRDQILVCLEDIGADAIKTGMLGSAEIVETVAEVLASRAKGIPLVVDPVLASTSGTKLLDERGISALREKLLPLATLWTPNKDEFAKISDSDPFAVAASAVLVTGGGAALETTTPATVADKTVTDVLWQRSTRRSAGFTGVWVETRHTHGTGCTLATAIACGLGEGMPLVDAILRARDYVFEAIRTAPGFGRGQGPLNHMHRRGFPRPSGGG